MAIRKTKSPAPLNKSESALLDKLLLRARANLQEIPGLHPLRNQEPTPPVDAVKAVLNQRGERYGDFTDHARLAQQIVDAMRHHTIPASLYLLSHGVGERHKPWDNLSAVQRQALTVIADKQARILNGDPNYDDNWIDIQGYARLAQERLPVKVEINTSE